MRIRWTRPALNDLDDIQNYVAQDSPAAAHRLINDLVERTGSNLGSAPMLGRVGRVADTRELILGDLPYIIVYRVTETVEILAVVHTARKWPEDFE